MSSIGVDPTEEDLVVGVHASQGDLSFVVVGDPGEGDFSQEVLTAPLLSVQEECAFLVICSDVVYPTGDVNQYKEKFYEPFGSWRKPIYALPGNHDWYDELEGFMYHFCGVDPPPEEFGSEIPRPPLWRRPQSREAEAERCRDARPPQRGPYQPAPYFVIDTESIAIVCIDTGIEGGLDRDQGEWLVRISKELRKPKVLLTGKPLIVDGTYAPGSIESFDRTVDDIVREPGNGYVAAVGGDIHNYQRYPVKVGSRCIEYIVSGGGGAFMHATHRIPRVGLGSVDEPSFRCFPLRGDSLWVYSSTLIPALRRIVVVASALVLLSTLGFAGLLVLLIALRASVPTWILSFLLAAPVLGGCWALWRQVASSGAPDVLGANPRALTHRQAETWMAEQIQEDPVLQPKETLTPDGRAVAEFVQPRLQRTGGILHSFFSEIFDVDEAPLYKQFLRFDVGRDLLRITCCAAIGDRREAARPYVEEWVEIPLEPVRTELDSDR
jgi:hypothetical protein